MANYSKLSALVVDDNAVIRMFYSGIFARLGFDKIVVAEDCKKAVDLHESGETYGLILMDMVMPVKDGAQATRKLSGMGIKSMIVGVTAYEDIAARRAFIASSLNGCLEKPLRIDVVAALTNQILNHQHSKF